MDYKSLSAGIDVPEDMNAIVEIPKGEGTIKYEYRPKTKRSTFPTPN